MATKRKVGLIPRRKKGTSNKKISSSRLSNASRKKAKSSPTVRK